MRSFIVAVVWVAVTGVTVADEPKAEAKNAFYRLHYELTLRD